MTRTKTNYSTFLGLIIFLFTLFSTVPSFSQCYKVESDISMEPLSTAQELHQIGIDTTSIDSIYKALREGILLESQYAALFLAEHGEQDAIELIKQKYEEEKKYPRAGFRYLKALKLLNATSFDELLISYVDLVYQKISSGNATISDYFVYQDATNMLIAQKNYSQFSRIIEQVKNNIDGENQDIILNLLASFFEVNQFREKVINTLQFVLQNYSNTDNLFYAVNFTCAFPDSKKLRQALKEVAVKTPSFDVRELALTRLQYTYKDPSLLDLVLKNLDKTNNPDEIENFLSIIKRQYNPHSLFLIKKLKENNASNIIREKAADVYKSYWWLHFEPYGKGFDYSVPQTLDSLIIYTGDIASYDWLGDTRFVGELKNRLDNARRHLSRGDSTNTAKQIFGFRQRIQQVYEQNKQGNNSPRFVSEDGYKFLYYNASYLLERLPDHPFENNKK